MKDILLEALQEIGKKPLNWSEFQRTTQREIETPDAFWVHLLEAGVAYAHLDLDSPKDKRLLVSDFIVQSTSNIRGHFHTLCQIGPP